MKPFVLAVSKCLADRNGTGGIDRAGELVVLRELDSGIEDVNRPRVVLDCSGVQEMGLPEIRLLVSCLERVMKRNGDARLAGLSPRAREVLSHTGAARLFRIYDSKESAIRSFDLHPNFEIVGEDGFGRTQLTSEDGDGTISPSTFRYAVHTAGERNEKCEEESE